MFTKISLRNIFFALGVISVFWWSRLAVAQSSSNSELAVQDSCLVTGRPIHISKLPIDEKLPAVAYNSIDREYLVVWSNIRGVNDIYAQRISELGKLLSWFYIANGEDPVVAYNPKNNSYLVVYSKFAGSDFDIYARRADYTGTPDSEFPVAFDLNDHEVSPAVAYNMHPNHDAFLVVWQSNMAQTPFTKNIEGQRVAGAADGGDGGGQTVGSPIAIAVSNEISYGPDIAYNLNMNEYMVVYTRESGGLDVYGSRVTANGVPFSEEPIDSSGKDQYNPVVAAYRLNQATPYLVVFNDTGNDNAVDVRGHLVNKQGQPIFPVNIANTSGQREYDPAIAHNEAWGGYIVSWTQGPAGDHDIYGMRISNTGVTNPEFDISEWSMLPPNCARQNPDIAVGDVSALVVWADPCGGAGGMDIIGRMLGYRVYLPMVYR